MSIGINTPTLIDLPVEHGKESTVVEIVSTIVDMVHVAPGEEPQVIVAGQRLEISHVERLAKAALVRCVTAESGKCRGTEAGIETFVKTEFAAGPIGLH